jgi:hypothetical protein
MFMFNDSYDFDQFLGWARAREKVSNPRLTSLNLQDCEEQSIVYDLQSFLRLLDQFMTQSRINL